MSERNAERFWTFSGNRKRVAIRIGNAKHVRTSVEIYFCRKTGTCSSANRRITKNAPRFSMQVNFRLISAICLLPSQMPFIPREEPFICEHCNANVQPLEKGSYRNHCPFCLFSKHVDDEGPGDRKSKCKGLMEPLSLDQDGKRGWIVVHRCLKCGKQMPNKAAPDDRLEEFARTHSY